MTRPSLRQALAGLLVVAVLLVPMAASAASTATAEALTGSAGHLPRLRDLLMRFWAQALAEGCGFGLDGLCAFSPVDPDHGCGIDPDGRCVGSSAADSDHGCGIDPSGQCAAATVSPDHGCIIDPNGGCTPIQ